MVVTEAANVLCNDIFPILVLWVMGFRNGAIENRYICCRYCYMLLKTVITGSLLRYICLSNCNVVYQLK